MTTAPKMVRAIALSDCGEMRIGGWQRVTEYMHNESQPFPGRREVQAVRYEYDDGTSVLVWLRQPAVTVNGTFNADRL